MEPAIPTPPQTRRALLRRWLLRGALATGGSGVALAAYGKAQVLSPVLERVTITLPDLPLAFDGLTAALLADLHVCPSFPAENLAPALALVQAAKPDLLLLAGDYISAPEGEYLTDMEACARALSPGAHAARLGAYACFGNHDFPPPPADPPRKLWLSTGIIPLLDERVAIRSEKAQLWLIGLRSSLSRPVDTNTALHKTKGEKTARIVLWHEPDNAERAARAGASLMLSGHTHGGQVVVPGVGPLRLPQAGRKYPVGLVTVEGMPLYTTRGVGALPPRVRLNCPPEVTLLTFRRGHAGARG